LSAAPGPAPRLAAGLIRGAHGLEGFVKVASLSGEDAHFHRLRRCYLRRGGQFTACEVEAVKGRGRELCLKLAGVSTPGEAAALRGAEIWVDRADACPLAEGEYYLADLCRCRLYRGQEELGRVLSVCEAGAGELLEVEAAGGRRFRVPFSGSFLGEVDVAGGRIALAEGVELP
jgi:16S rRNA processing protein RimM